MGSAKSLDDMTSVQITNGEAVTAALTSSVDSGAFYIEDDSRASGIKVISGYPAVVGNRVSVEGMIDTVNGERVIEASSVTAAAGTNIIAPLGATNKSLIGNGLSMTGLLAKTWGLVTSAGDSVWTPLQLTAWPDPNAGSTNLSTLTDGILGNTAEVDTTYCVWGWDDTVTLYFDYGQVEPFNSIAVTGFNNPNGSTQSGPQQIGVSYENPDGTWSNQVLYTVTQAQSPVFGQYTVQETLTPFNARFVDVEIVPSQANSNTLLCLSEVDLSGPDYAHGPYVTINDGSGLNVNVDTSNVSVGPSANEYVSLTGIRADELVNQTAAPVIIPRGNADVSWSTAVFTPVAVPSGGLTCWPSPSAGSTNLSTLTDGILGNPAEVDTTYCVWGWDDTVWLYFNYGSVQHFDAISVTGFNSPNGSTQSGPQNITISYGTTNLVLPAVTQAESPIQGRYTVERTFTPFDAQNVTVEIVPSQANSNALLCLSEVDLGAYE